MSRWLGYVFPCYWIQELPMHQITHLSLATKKKLFRSSFCLQLVCAEHLGQEEQASIVNRHKYHPIMTRNIPYTLNGMEVMGVQRNRFQRSIWDHILAASKSPGVCIGSRSCCSMTIENKIRCKIIQDRKTNSSKKNPQIGTQGIPRAQSYTDVRLHPFPPAVGPRVALGGCPSETKQRTEPGSESRDWLRNLMQVMLVVLNHG